MKVLMEDSLTEDPLDSIVLLKEIDLLEETEALEVIEEVLEVIEEDLELMATQLLTWVKMIEMPRRELLEVSKAKKWPSEH